MAFHPNIFLLLLASLSLSSSLNLTVSKRQMNWMGGENCPRNGEDDCAVLDIDERHFGSSHSNGVYVNFGSWRDFPDGGPHYSSPCYLLDDKRDDDMFRSCESSMWQQRADHGGPDHDGLFCPGNWLSEANRCDDFSKFPASMLDPIDFAGVSLFWGDDICLSRFTFTRGKDAYQSSGAQEVEVDFRHPFFKECLQPKGPWPFFPFDSVHGCLHLYGGVENRASTLLIDFEKWNSYLEVADPTKFNSAMCDAFTFFPQSTGFRCHNEDTIKIKTSTKSDYCVADGPERPEEEPLPLGCPDGHCSCSSDEKDLSEEDCCVVDVDESPIGGSHSLVHINLATYASIDYMVPDNHPNYMQYHPTRRSDSSCYILNDYLRPQTNFRHYSSSRWTNPNFGNFDTDAGNAHAIQHNFNFQPDATHIGVSVFWGDDLCISRFEFKRGDSVGGSNIPFDVNVDFHDPDYKWEDCMKQWEVPNAFLETHRCLHINPYEGDDHIYGETPATVLIDIQKWKTWTDGLERGDYTKADLGKCRAIETYLPENHITCSPNWLLGDKEQTSWEAIEET